MSSDFEGPSAGGISPVGAALRYPRAPMRSDSSDEREPLDRSGATPEQPGTSGFDPTQRVDLAAADRLGQEALRAEVRARMFGGAPEAPKVGRYAILKLLGEGGMGAVYAAYDDQLDRRVAIKVLKSAGTADARQRMLREAQALARLSHPNVVPVFEVGEHDGQLFVAMEYVRGMTLARWRTETDPGWREIVKIYVEAGRGLQAAHDAGMVHRDFKPQNAVVGSDGRVRVLDFGLAVKQGATDITSEQSMMLPSPQHDALDSPLTESGAVMGTPAYMPPEQFMGGEIDPRGDQFSFCVALWEALYGERPFSGTNAAEIFTRVAQGKLVAPRTTNVPAAILPILQRGLRVTAVERWPDMGALLSALARWELRARTKRRAGGVAAITAAIATAFGWHHYQRARKLDACTEAGESIAETWNDTAREKVRTSILATQMSYASTTADKVVPLLDAQAVAWRDARTQVCVDTEIAGTWSTDTHERAQWCLDERRLQLEAAVHALMDVDPQGVQKAISMASALNSVEQCTDAATLARLVAPPGDSREAIRTARSQIYRAFVLSRPSEGLEVARAARDAAAALGWPPLLASAELALGTRLAENGELGEAERMLEDAYFRAELAGAHEVAVSASDALLFVVGYQRARLDDGLRWGRLAELSLASLGDDGATTRAAAHLTKLGSAYGANGDPAKAKPLHARALAIWEDVVGPEHPNFAIMLNGLAGSHAALGEYAEAEALLTRSLEISENVFGPEHPNVAVGLVNLANVDFQMGRFDDANAKYQRALVVSEAALGTEHPNVASVLENLGDLRARAGEHGEAKALLERSLAIREQVLGAEHPDVARSLASLAEVSFDAGDYARAQALDERALAISEKAFGPEHPHVGGALMRLARTAVATSRFTVAIALAERALALGGDGPGPALVAAESRFALARALWDAPPDRGRDRDRAIAVGVESRDGFRRLDGSSSSRLVEVERWLHERHAM